MTPTWNLRGHLDGWAVEFHGEVVGTAPNFHEARDLYNDRRAHAAMAMESLKHTLGKAKASEP